MAFKAIKARIQDGKLGAEAPPGYPEGTELEIELLDDLEAELSPEKVTELNRRIELSRRQVQAGQHVPAEVVLTKLRSRIK